MGVVRNSQRVGVVTVDVLSGYSVTQYICWFHSEWGTYDNYLFTEGGVHDSQRVRYVLSCVHVYSQRVGYVLSCVHV